MKKSFLLLAVAAFALVFSASAALAGGDKVHGEKAAGDPGQICANFGECSWE